MLTLDAFLAQLWPSFLLFFGFVAGIFLLSKLLPGRVDVGVPHKNEAGEVVQIRYVLNGLTIFLIVAALLVTAIADGLPVHRILDYFWGLFFWANVFSWVGTGVLQWAGYRKRAQHAPQEPTGVRINADGTASATGAASSVASEGLLKDYFMGVELNPSLFGVDLKMFSYKPSLIGLFVLNVSFAAVQLHTYGGLSNAMILYQLFTAIYIFNYFHFEYGMVFTWDIIAERFGWMLVWGDYAFVPFAYCVVGWYLVDPTNGDLPAGLTVLCVALFALGLWIFRGSNEQKDQFKRDPQKLIWGKPPESIQGRILISGFWGIGRKLNYTGEITIYTSWALLTQFVSPVPFILPLWLFCLLVHRAWRDDLKCRAKYGPTWEAYCEKARFRMIPFIY